MWVYLIRAHRRVQIRAPSAERISSRDFTGDQRAYKMADGSVVLTSTTQPLPAAVQTDIAVREDVAITADGSNIAAVVKTALTAVSSA